MKKICIAALGFVLSAGLAIAQTAYPVSDIPKKLLNHADLVVREYNVVFEVLNKKEAVEIEHKVVTILNSTGAKEAIPVFPYSDFERIEDIEAAVYEADGKLVRRLKNKDIIDGKPVERAVNDERYKVLNLPARAFPYTVEYTVKRKYNGLMFYPVFQPQENEGVSVQSAHLTLKMPPGLEVRVKAVNLPENSNVEALNWDFKNIPAFVPEPYAPDKDTRFAQVITAPTDFEFGDVPGDMRSWEAYGKYFWQLNSTQATLPSETIAMLQKMVADCPDAECKIRRLYDYLQNNTRYFFVGLGIGGWQAAKASDVDHSKYGDCKGLSNYMVSMLKAVNVPAFYTIIRAGDDEMHTQFPDFPNAWFNHIIVCVPLEHDTMWLECTSQTESCGFLSNFTDNRPAFVITPQGGRLVQTPKYDEHQNTIRRHTTIQLADDGSATLLSKDAYSGVSQDIVAALAELSGEFRQKYLYKTLNVSDFEIKSLEFKREKSRLPSVTESLELRLPRLASTSGKRLFVPVSLMCVKQEIPTLDSIRHSNVQADPRGYTEESTTTLEIPEGYRLEAAFVPVDVTTAFGHFELSAQEQEGKLLINRKLTLNSSVQPNDQFSVFVQFLKSVAKADKSKLVLIKRT
jgi:hypothetical protein